MSDELIQESLVEARINIVRVLEGMAGDREKCGQQGYSPEQELELWRAKANLAEARILLMEVSQGS